MSSSRYAIGKPVLFSVIVVALASGMLLGSCGGAQKSTGIEPAQVLPPLKIDPFVGLDPLGKDDKQAFTFRTGPKPPPSITKKVTLKFPVAQRAKIAARAASRKVASGPLKVVRLQPHGKVKTVGAVTVSFNQAMVPVASLAELKTLDVPVSLSPQPKGRWRWLGTRTVAFEPSDGRMPYSTDYTVTIPAGTKSALGGRLEREKSVAFSTPTPKILRGLPHRSSNQARPDTAIALLFNQKVDRRRVLARLTMNPGNLHGDDVDLLPPETWAKLPDIGPLLATWDPDRVVVFRPKTPLSKATSYHVRIRLGLRGEGPKLSTSDLLHLFRTYSPLKVDFFRCADRRRCNPRSGFYARFNNSLVTSDLRHYVRFTPSVPNLQAQVRGRYVSFRGDFKPQTTYRVLISQDKAETGPTDIHGQQLLSPFKKAVKTGDLKPE
ncbi:MAG: hypothetical protein KAI47_01175, partial [Deltaproteobacteria bacterium]|nr:hypothetical protein [Deltaproteobacteria bacterium]